MHKNEFVQAINSGFSSGGMFCILSDGELGNFLFGKVMEFMKDENPKTLQAVANIGLQKINLPIYVFSSKVK